MTTIVDENDEILKDIEEAGQKIEAIRAETGKVIFGQEKVIENTLLTVLAGGHALLIGVPGVAKTLLVETLGTVLGIDNRRIQFTPDLMPSDIIGSEVLEEGRDGTRAFRFIKGPVFTRLLMADEINRASPKTQSALLQAMQEREVTFAGELHKLPQPFHVLATQNPLEQEGTYPLPEAQLDRFLMQIDVDYPDREAERKMLIATTGTEHVESQKIISVEELLRLQEMVPKIPVGNQVIDAILELVRMARPGANGGRAEKGAKAEANRYIAWGPGPRASQSLMKIVRARALIEGRFAPSVDDVIAMAEPILKHRMALTYGARGDKIGVSDIIEELVKHL